MTIKLETTDLIEGYLSKHPDIDDLINNINESEKMSGASLLKFGDKLAEIRDEIEVNEIISKSIKKKIFTQLKKQTAERVHAFDVNTINRIVKISTHAGIRKFRQEGKLPERWGTLALLTNCTQEFIQQLIDNGSLDSNTSRKELKIILDGNKPEIFSKNESIMTITLTSCNKNGLIELETIKHIDKIAKELKLNVKISG